LARAAHEQPGTTPTTPAALPPSVAPPGTTAPPTFPPPDLPLASEVVLPGRGSTLVHDVPGPDPAAPTVILLHGWTANAALAWHPAFWPLAARYRVLALDHRGHGGGLRTGGRFRLEDCADDVAALADVLGIERAVAVGYSMGGPIAQLLWRRHRRLVDGLVLCATAARFLPDDLRGRTRAGAMGALAVATWAAPEPLRRRVAERAVAGRRQDTPLGRWAADEIREHDVRSLVDAGHALARFSSEPWVGEVDVPTAVVVTDDDQVVAPARQLALAAAVPGATAFHVPGGHDVCATGPQVFVPALLAACADVATRADRADRADRA
jgi:3-oxoadipate enol-lactonase